MPLKEQKTRSNQVFIHSVMKKKSFIHFPLILSLSLKAGLDPCKAELLSGSFLHLRRVSTSSLNKA